MVTLPFLNRSSNDSHNFVFILFLAGKKAFGFAFNQLDPKVRSTLYQEDIDPFLKNAEEKIERLLENSERDLNTKVFLHNTLLVLNSLYLNENGTVRDDFVKPIKKLLETLELKNLGFVGFYESVLHYWSGKTPSFCLIEESVYDYALFFFANKQLLKSQKIAKNDNEEEEMTQIKDILQDQENIVGFYNGESKEFSINKQQVIQKDLYPEIFQNIFSEKQNGSSSKPAEVISPIKKTKIESSQVLPDKEKPFLIPEIPLAAGFAPVLMMDNEAMGTEKKTVEPEKLNKLAFSSDFGSVPYSKTSSNKFKFSFPANLLINKRLLIFVFPVLLIFLILIFYFFIYKVNIQLTFHSQTLNKKINLTITKETKGVEVFSTNLEFPLSYKTIGEKQTGEKALGEVTVFNKTSEKKTLSIGTKLYSKENVFFVTKEEVTVPSATTSANVGQETKTFGKTNVEVEGAAIGAEGNIENNTKLNFSDYKDDEMYAVASKDFSGGYKKIIAIFSEADKTTLQKKITAKIDQEVQLQFKNKGINGYLFLDTLTINQQKSSPQYKVGEEIEDLNLKLNVGIKVYYFSRVELEKTLVNDPNKIRINLLKIQDLKLQKTKGKDTYYYGFKAVAETQNIIEKTQIISKIVGRPFSQAQVLFSQEKNIEEVKISAFPFQLFILPLRAEQIQIENR